jgi:hypothetical protein
MLGFPWLKSERLFGYGSKEKIDERVCAQKSNERHAYNSQYLGWHVPSRRSGIAFAERVTK